MRFVAFGLMLSFIAVGCDRDTAGRNAGGGRVVPVTTQTVHTADWRDSLQALGTVKARESVALTASVSEIVDQVHFESGDAVQAGQLLVSLRGQAQHAALAEAEAAYNEADQLYRRQSALADRQLIARATLDLQKALRDAEYARVQRMQSDIQDRHIRAPFDGTMGIRRISPGSLVTANTVVATLDDLDRVYVDFPMPETNLAHLQVGDSVSGRNAAFPEREFTGVVTAIDAQIDAVTRAVTVRAEFPNADHALRSGMLMKVNLYQSERKTLMVPEISIVQVGRESYVFKVDEDDFVERADVVLGVRRDGQVEILNGLNDGDRIVVGGTNKLRPGLMIKDTARAQPFEANG